MSLNLIGIFTLAYMRSLVKLDGFSLRNVLTDPDLVRVLTDNQFIVWGGDIRDREAYQGKL